MMTISLWEPWATAIAIGAKRIETRGWYTHYRGPLAIHAAKTREHADFIFDPEVRSAFERAGITSIKRLPFGCVVATCRLIGCVPTGDLCRGRFVGRELTQLEWAFGNYTCGRFGWLLSDVVRLEKPVPAKGRQGFWDWSPPGT